MPLELFVSYIFLVINKNVVTSGKHNISKNGAIQSFYQKYK